MIERVPDIRLYQAGDEIGITKLFRDIFGREMTLDEWRWKYTGRENRKVYSSVAVNETGDIVAHYGGIPHRMIYQGREVYGLAIGDVMVHSSFRRTRLFKKVASLVPEEAVRDGIILGYGFPSERHMRLSEKLGLYEKIEDVFEADKEVKFTNNLRRLIYEFFPLDYDDSRIDALWESLKERIKLAVIRDGEYLRWRYQRHPFFKYELWGLKKRWSGRLEGLAVLRDDGERKLLIDFLSPVDSIDILFQEVENCSFRSGKKTLALWFPGYMRHRLAEEGFSIRPAATCVPRTTHERTLTKDQMKGQFFYTMGDTDFQ